MTEEICRRCGKPIVMMCQRFTGFCCGLCEEPRVHTKEENIEFRKAWDARVKESSNGQPQED